MELIRYGAGFLYWIFIHSFIHWVFISYSFHSRSIQSGAADAIIDQSPTDAQDQQKVMAIFKFTHPGDIDSI